MEIGFNKTEITCFVKGKAMLGYGNPLHTSEYVETPLYARTFIFGNDTKKYIGICVCELGFITPILKKKSLEYIQAVCPDFKDEDFILTAQHTHSGPSGYSDYVLYNISTPGFQPTILEHLSRQISCSVLDAIKNSSKRNLILKKGAFDLDDEVAFIRSVAAYNANIDVDKITPETSHLGTNREMILLDIQNKEGISEASINWFGVHPTSLSNNLHGINADNKGYAASFLEEKMGVESPNYIGAFAQGVCGDVSPKFKYNPIYPYTRGQYEGKYADDVESAKYNGLLQSQKAFEIISATSSRTIEGKDIQSFLYYVDFSKIQIKNTSYATTESTLGLAFIKGCNDGLGAPPFLLSVIKTGLRIKAFFQKEKNPNHGEKQIVANTAKGVFLGIKNFSKLPAFIDKTVEALKKMDIRGALASYAWSPQIIAIQFFRLDDIGIIAFPFELTTIAGKRLKQAILENTNLKEVILCPYSNAYTGYITTPEEYSVQEYEGGHTVFGKWSLLALQQVVIDCIQNPQRISPVKPIDFSEEHFTQMTLN